GFSLPVFAQIDTSQITVKQGISPKVFYLGKKLNSAALGSLVIQSKNTLALMDYQRYRRNLTMATISGVAGGALIGYAFGDAIFAGNDLKMPLLLAGLGLVGVDMLFNTSANKSLYKAVEHYNSRKTGFLLRPARKGIGLAIEF
ncbi:MAG: hypothetical protein H7Y04_11280, partial [Verrucomicrobia bacterium]|nr:hypothetical protein [Cytophagales bacterium]